MRILLSATLVIAGAMPLAPALAANPYVAAGISFGDPWRLDGPIDVNGTNVGTFSADPSNEIGGELAFGAYFSRRLAGEIAVRYSSADIRTATIAGQVTPVDSSIETLTVLARGRFVLLPDGRVRPYVGGGIGVQRVEVGSVDRTGFAYEGQIGATVPLGRRWEVDGAVRYTGSTAAAFDAGAGVAVRGLRYETLGGAISLRYRFGGSR